MIMAIAVADIAIAVREIERAGQKRPLEQVCAEVAMWNRVEPRELQRSYLAFMAEQMTNRLQEHPLLSTTNQGTTGTRAEVPRPCPILNAVPAQGA
jgi:hypothetical protein